MRDIVVACKSIEQAEKFRAALQRNGMPVTAVCSSGAQILQTVERLANGWGVVISTTMRDMPISEIVHELPENFKLLLLRSSYDDLTPEDVDYVTLPLKVSELIDASERMLREIDKNYHRVRSEEDKKFINEAKYLLMEKYQMSEIQAHRYIQKRSMDRGTKMIETAMQIINEYNS